MVAQIVPNANAELDTQSTVITRVAWECILCLSIPLPKPANQEPVSHYDRIVLWIRD